MKLNKTVGLIYIYMDDWLLGVTTYMNFKKYCLALAF